VIDPATHLAVVDALYGFAEALDTKDAEAFAAVFLEDGTLDFSPGGRTLGLDFPPIEGRDQIVEGIFGALATITTTHTIGNPRVTLDGDRARATALVEAQHVVTADRTRHLLLKNRYTVDLEADGPGWRIRRLEIATVWWTGEPALLGG
jgi:ketosteroid isomerase-like protein